MTNTDNPHNFTESTLERIAEASAKMYDEFWELLADYQFNFTLEEKLWMLDRIKDDIAKVTREASEG